MLSGRPLIRCERGGFSSKLRTLYGPPLVYEDSLPFDVIGGPFGEIRVDLSSALIRNQISPGPVGAAANYALASVFSPPCWRGL